MKREKFIREEMKKRMSDMGRVGGESYSPKDGRVRPNGHTLTENTSTRKELAKLANTSEGFDIDVE